MRIQSPPSRYRAALEVFGRRVSDENGTEPLDSLDRIPSGTSRNYDPAPTPAEKADTLDDMIVENIAGATDEEPERLLAFRDAAKNNPELRAEAIAEIGGILDAD